MTTFKTFFAIIKKRINNVLLYFFIFMGVGIAFTFASQSNGNPANFESYKSTIVIFDNDNTTESKKYTEYLRSNNKVKEMEDDMIIDALQSGVIDNAIYIPKGFSKSLKDKKLENIIEIKSVGESYTKTIITAQTEEYLKLGIIYNETENNMSTALDMAKENLKNSADVSKNVEEKTENSKTDDYYFYFFKYLPYVAIMMIVNGMTMGLLPFNNKEIRKRVSASAEKFSEFNKQLIYASLILVSVIFILLILASIAIYGKFKFDEKLPMYILNALCVVLVSTAYAYLVSKFAKKVDHLPIASNVAGLGMSFLCGVFIPFEMLDENLIKFSRFLPFYWNEKAIVLISKNNFSGKDAAICFGLQLIMAVIIVVIALAVAKAKQKEE